MNESQNRELTLFAARVAVAVAITLGMVSLLALLWVAADVLLLGFAGVLLAVLLRGSANWLAARSPLGKGLSVTLVIIVLVLLVGAGIWIAASPVVREVDQLAETLVHSAAYLQQRLLMYEWGEWLVEQAETIDWGSRRMDLVGKTTGALSTAFGTVINLVVIGFLGLYLAIQPHIYINGALRLVPSAVRPRFREVLHEMGRTLRNWLIGILCSMTIVGIMSGVGLWLLKVPFALALGVMAALLCFVPYLGPIMAAVPAMLIAMIHGQEYALYVLALYFGIQMVEGYLLNPVIQQYAVSLPAALLLFAQVVMAILLGGLGVVLAAPIAATIMVAVKMLYVQDILGDQIT